VHPLGIERLSVFGMPPVDFVGLAADLGCDLVGIGLAPSGDFNPQGFARWSLRDDPQMRADLRYTLDDRGLRIGIVEGFAILPGHDPRAFAADLDLVSELGGARIAAVSLDKDIGRTIDGFAILCELAAERGLLMSIEMGSLGPIDRVEPALKVVRGVGLANLSLILDAMHFFRLGNTVEDMRTIPPELIGYAQLCDVPWAPRFETYMEEAMYERLAPGDGELPLADFVAALPEGVDVSLEIPMRAKAIAGQGPRERLAPCVAAARRLVRGAG
jgi:sugar phosphate isomerase/epimerase